MRKMIVVIMIFLGLSSAVSADFINMTYVVPPGSEFAIYQADLYPNAPEFEFIVIPESEMGSGGTIWSGGWMFEDRDLWLRVDDEFFKIGHESVGPEHHGGRIELQGTSLELYAPGTGDHLGTVGGPSANPLIPEPATMMLLVPGILCLCKRRKRPQVK
ncbi:hypothetical protein [Poriferisphaera sp. WC338]|uniref:hypothetical protein n=1 Tax=Poriferisphaera sp. WC338 TaxID=3425129 RepID=UPI003D81C371